MGKGTYGMGTWGFRNWKILASYLLGRQWHHQYNTVLVYENMDQYHMCFYNINILV